MSVLLTVAGRPGQALPFTGGAYDASAQLWHPRLTGSAMAETSAPTPSATTMSSQDMDMDDMMPDPDPDPRSDEP